MIFLGIKAREMRLFAGALATLMLPATAGAAVLAGQTVSVNSRSVDTLFNLVDGGALSTVAPDTVAISGSYLSATYTDQQITIFNSVPNSSTTFLTANFFTGTPFSFNGLRFVIGSSVLTQVQIDPGSTVAGAAVVNDASHIFLDLRGLSFATGENVILNLNGFVPAGGVPEPASWAMLIAGFGIVGSAQRRRRAATVAA